MALGSSEDLDAHTSTLQHYNSVVCTHSGRYSQDFLREGGGIAVMVSGALYAMVRSG